MNNSVLPSAMDLALVMGRRTLIFPLPLKSARKNFCQMICVFLVPIQTSLRCRAAWQVPPTARITSPDFLFSFFPPHYFFSLNILVPCHANNPSLFILSSLSPDWLPLYAENGKSFWCGKWQIW